MRDRLAAWLICRILHSIASLRMRRLWHEAVQAWMNVDDLRKAIELVLLNHAWEIDRPPGQQDPDLAELAHVYKRITGFDAIKEAARGQRQDSAR